MVLTALFNVDAQCILDKSNYRLVFWDDFNTEPDEVNPSYDLGGNHAEQLKKKWDLLPMEGVGDNYPNPATADVYDPNGFNRCWGWGHGMGATTTMNGIVYEDKGEFYDESQVELIPGGYLRLKAVREEKFCQFPNVDFITDPNAPPLRNFHFTHKSGMIKTKYGNTVYDLPSNHAPKAVPEGFKDGMFEIRCKLPEQCNFSAFWLWGGLSEIDIFEYNGGTQNREFISNQHYSHAGVQSSYGHAYRIYNGLNLDERISDNFHTWTCVWTSNLPGQPNTGQVTIFFDNRELKTMTANVQPTYNQLNTLMAGLQMWPWCNDEEVHMDIDYIRVYKPVGNDYSLPYKTTEEYRFAKVLEEKIEENIGNSAVSLNHKSVAYDQNSNTIYHVKDKSSTDHGWIFESYINNGNWETKRINLNYNVSHSNWKSSGELVYNPVHNMILYRGWDDRIQYFKKLPNGQYQQWWIDEDWGNPTTRISGTHGSMAIDADGNIGYKGMDNKMHRFYYDWQQAKWKHQFLNHPSNSWTDVKGDVVIEKVTGNILYKGKDNRVQAFYTTGINTFAHAWLDGNFSNPATQVHKEPSSMVSTINNGIFYKGAQDNKIHNLKWNGTAMVHSILPHNYGNCAGWPQADYVKNGLAYDNIHDKLFYVGFEGRIQYFEKNNNIWSHHWANNHFNNALYICPDLLNVSGQSSLIINENTDQLMFATRRKHLGIANWESCENLNPPNTTDGLPTNGTNTIFHPLYKNAGSSNQTPIEKQQSASINLYPNPVTGILKVSIPSTVYKNDEVHYTISTIEGRVLINMKANVNEEIEINCEGLSKGVYFFHVEENGYSAKFVKQ